MKNKIIIIGKAASGKDYLQNQLISMGAIPLRQYTTRPKRPNEKGDEYHFVSEEEFDNISDRLFSIQIFKGWKYGFDLGEALKSDVMILSPANVFDIIFSSNFNCKNLLDSSIIVYLDINEKTRRARLSKRYVGGNEDDSLERRIQADKEDFKFFDNINWIEKSDSYYRLCNEKEVDEFLKKLLT